MFTTMTPGDPESEAAARLLQGVALSDTVRLTSGEEGVFQRELARIWERLLHNAGVTTWLAPGQDLGSMRGGMPRRTVRAKGGRTEDLVRLIPWVLREKIAGDTAYEDAARREEQVTSGHGLQPGDAASLRFRSTSPPVAQGRPPGPGREEEVARFLELQALMAMYTATPHFVPSHSAFDAATGLPPEPGARLRLTSEAVLVFHDGVPLPAVIADDEALHAHATAHFGADHDMLFGASPLVMGGVVLARPDDGSDQALLFDPLVGWLIIAHRAHNGRYAWAMHLVDQLDANPGPAARVLRNYAALNALEGWDTPPRIPGQARSSGKSKKKPQAPAAERRRQQLEQAARTPQAQRGALLGVRVLTFTAPPHEAAPPPPAPSAGSPGRAPAQYREWRRAHWTRNTRVHLLDENGRPSGPVYGPDAVEGVTFTRRRTRVKGTWVNEHLPPRPGQRPVYAVDPKLTRTPADSS
ncbi:hypothetical protein ACWD3I_24895 [Streptomyces sp. NPDC002817]|uniref:hypothetical protein n=1 Tax=Streptomyces sp. NPDC088357 TaxID=3154655 RepID=UPI0034286589